MPGFEYWNSLFNSFKDLKNNPVLVVPILLQFLVSVVVIGILFLLSVLIFVGINLGNIGQMFTADFLLSLLTPTNIILLAVIIFVGFIILLAAVTFFTAGFAGMINEVRLKGKTSMATMGYIGKKYFSCYFKVMLIKMLIEGIPIMIIILAFGIPLINMIMTNSFSLSPAWIVGFILVLLLYGLYSIFFWIVFFFIMPKILDSNPDASPIEIIKQSAKYSFRNFVHLLAVFGILLLLGLVVGMAFSMIEMPLRLAAEASAGFTLILIPLALIRLIVNIIIQIVSTLYLFKAYFAKVK